MNERIQELMEQAMELVDPYALEGEFGPRLLNAEKFAELIVEECLNLVDRGGEFVSRPKLVERIKEHFGIDKP